MSEVSQPADALLALAAAHPTRTVHVHDLPYRLAKPIDPGDLRLWHRDARLVGWARRQSIETDIAIDSSAAGVLEEAVVWAEERFAGVAKQRGQPAAPWWIATRADDRERIELLERRGWQRGEQWTTTHFERRLDDDLPASAPPAGFQIRPLSGAGEVPAYVSAHRAAFGSENMTVEWRSATLRMPEHRPDLDLVAEPPDGTLAAFAVIWLVDGVGQFEPIGTRPEYQRRGLARALIVEGFRRLRELGATKATVETDTWRDAGHALYESLFPERGPEIRHYYLEA